MTNVNVSDRSVRIANAARLSELKNQTASTGVDAEKAAIQEELKKEKMDHPFESGKKVSAVYFSEIFLRYNMTIQDWLSANFTPNSEVEKLKARIEELEASTKTAPVIKK